MSYKKYSDNTSVSEAPGDLSTTELHPTELEQTPEISTSYLEDLNGLLPINNVTALPDLYDFENEFNTDGRIITGNNQEQIKHLY